MSETKPPLGVKPAQLHAWQRIGDLAAAIKRQYESTDGSPVLVETWAEEIVLQSKMIRRFTMKEDT